MHISYRLMNINDYEQVYALWILCGNGLNDKDDSYAGIEKYLKRNPTTSFVALDGEKIVGVILCGHDGRRGIIQHACVSPDYRRYGIGKKLWRSMRLKQKTLPKSFSLLSRKTKAAMHSGRHRALRSVMI